MDAATTSTSPNVSTSATLASVSMTLPATDSNNDVNVDTSEATTSTATAKKQMHKEGTDCHSLDIRLIEELKCKILELRNLPSRYTNHHIRVGMRVDGDDICRGERVLCTGGGRVDVIDELCAEMPSTSYRNAQLVLLDEYSRPFAVHTFKKSDLIGLSTTETTLQMQPYKTKADVNGKVCLQLDYCDTHAGSSARSHSLPHDNMATLDRSPSTDKCHMSTSTIATSSVQCAQTQHQGAKARKLLNIRIVDYCDLHTSASTSASMHGIATSPSGPTGGRGPADLYSLVTLHKVGQSKQAQPLYGTQKLRIARVLRSGAPRSSSWSASTEEIGDWPQVTVDLGKLAADIAQSSDNNQHAYYVKVSLWHDVLGGLNSVFHGEVKVPLEPTTLMPIRNGNGDVGDGSFVAWYYLRARGSSNSPAPPLHDLNSAAISPDKSIQMRVKIRYDIHHVLPAAHYAGLLKTLTASITDCDNSDDPASSFALSPIGVIESLPNYDTDNLVGRPLMQIALYSEQIRPLIRVTAAFEMAKCAQDASTVNTLFRSSSLASKLVSETMKRVGKTYMQTTLNQSVSKICRDHLSTELDAARLAEGENLAENTTRLLAYSHMLLRRIVDNHQQCPTLMKEIFSDLRALTQQYFGATSRSSGSHSPSDVHRLVLSSFIIMRYFAAAIHSPKIFALRKENPDGRTCRTLALVSKLIQRLSNAIVSRKPLPCKEPWLEPAMRSFINSAENRHNLCQLLDRLSLSHATETVDTTPTTIDPQLMNIIHETTVIERLPGKRRACPPFSSFRWSTSGVSRKVHVILTDEELIWTSDKADVMSQPLGRVALMQLQSIDGVSNTPTGSPTKPIDANMQAFFGAKHWHVVDVCSTGNDRHVYWQCATRSEMNELVSAVRRQVRRVRHVHIERAKGAEEEEEEENNNQEESFMSDDRSLSSTRNSQSFDAIDVDRQLEHIHYACIEHADTLRQWRDHLSGGNPLPTIPPPHYYAQLGADEKGTLLRSMDSLLANMYSVERAHHEAVKRYYAQLVSHAGTKDNPIGDDNYLWLKCRVIREI